MTTSRAVHGRGFADTGGTAVDVLLIILLAITMLVLASLHSTPYRRRTDADRLAERELMREKRRGSDGSS